MTGLGVDPPIGTDRLVLRALRPDDLEDVHAFQRDPEVVRHLPWEVRTRAQTQSWLDGRIAADRLDGDGDAATWGVERRADGRVVGSVNLWWRSAEHQQGEFGYVLAADAQGHGYALEATTALLDVAFPALDLHRVCARTAPANAASIALLGRLGLRQEAHLRESERVKGAWVDFLVFAVLREEWEASRR